MQFLTSSPNFRGSADPLTWPSRVPGGCLLYTKQTHASSVNQEKYAIRLKNILKTVYKEKTINNHFFPFKIINLETLKHAMIILHFTSHLSHFHLLHLRKPCVNRKKGHSIPFSITAMFVLSPTR